MIEGGSLEEDYIIAMTQRLHVKQPGILFSNCMQLVEDPVPLCVLCCRRSSCHFQEA